MADPPAATADATPFLVTNRVRRLGGAILPVARIPLGATQGSKKSTMVAGAKGTCTKPLRGRDQRRPFFFVRTIAKAADSQ